MCACAYINIFFVAKKYLLLDKEIELLKKIEKLSYRTILRNCSLIDSSFNGAFVLHG